MKRSSHYFTVNFAYTVSAQPASNVSHELEYCPKRVVPYVHKAGFCEESLLGQSVCNYSRSVETEVLENASLTVDLPDSEEAASNSSDSSGSSTLVSNVDAQEQCHATKTSVIQSEELFFRSEALGTTVEPQCGSCKCTNCPVPGSKYSFQEQKQYDIIQKNLQYNALERRWYTIYPWLYPRSTLPKNNRIAYQSLCTLERKLSQMSQESANEFCLQIEGMIERGSAVLLTDEVLEAWDGDFYYLPIVGVKGKDNKSTRLCFDASRRQGGYPSMNECLCKGPNRFLNNLLAVLLGFRNGRVGCVANISKFHNQVCNVFYGVEWTLLLNLLLSQ